jgi:hypothetical protein
MHEGSPNRPAQISWSAAGLAEDDALHHGVRPGQRWRTVRNVSGVPVVATAIRSIEAVEAIGEAMVRSAMAPRGSHPSADRTLKGPEQPLNRQFR